MNILVFEKLKSDQAKIGKAIRKRYNSFSILFTEKTSQIERVEHSVELVIVHYKLYEKIKGWFPQARIVVYRKAKETATEFAIISLDDLEDRL